MTKPRVTEKQILVVEDEPAVAMAIRMFLALDRHSVDVAADGASGLARFKESKFDLVITDFEMPGMTGGELAARIKRLSPRQPVLLVSSFVESLRSRPPGIDGMLAKPFSLQGLRDSIARLLGHEEPESDLCCSGPTLLPDTAHAGQFN